MRLSDYIRQHKEPILQHWEAFACSIKPRSMSMDSDDLRDHASLILDTIADDVDRSTSRDNLVAVEDDSTDGEKRYGREHARQRLEAGFTIGHLLAEFRELRRNVLRSWTTDYAPSVSPDCWLEIFHFNESIDRVQAESVSSFVGMTEARERAGSSDRLKAATALRESEAKFRTIADTMPQMVWSARPDGFHDYHNRQWYEFTGAGDGSSDGDSWRELTHPDDEHHAWQLWRHSLSTGDPYEVLYRMRHHSGAYRWALSRAMPVRDETGRIIRWMGSCTDIHDQKLEEQELQETSKRKDEFLAMLAHELRNPLAPISTAAQLLKMSGAENERISSYSDILIRQVRHLTELVDDLLDVSRVTRGLIQLEREEVDMKAVLSSAVEQARPVIEGRQHMLHLQMAAEPAFVDGDKTRLVQVVVNLLNNSAKYTPEGGEIDLLLKVITADPPNNSAEVEICVADNGNGISPTLLPYVFDLFTQGQRTPDRNQGGLGLGLTLVKSITRLHGGRVSAYSEGPGKGSTFRLYLPLLQRTERQAAHTPVTKLENPGRTLRLMVVDDNEDAARSLATLLELKGHHVVVETTGTDALDAAMLDAIHVFILDIGLPGMDGYTLARRLRAHPHTSSAKLIALTGYGQPQDQILAREAGFDHHFIKPIDTTKLYEILSAIDPESSTGKRI